MGGPWEVLGEGVLCHGGALGNVPVLGGPREVVGNGRPCLGGRSVRSGVCVWGYLLQGAR